MQTRMAEMRDRESAAQRQKCFGILHDAVLYTGDRINDMSGDSLVGYIELAARTVGDSKMLPGYIGGQLSLLGFSISQSN